MTIIVLEGQDSWERALPQALKFVHEEETVLVVHKEAVKRCIRCEPELFKHLHQFILDGGRALLCRHCLEKQGIPPSRPPEIFTQIDSAEEFIEEKRQAGHQILYF